MTGEELLRAVLVRPEDLARRLVYADYLQHHGDPQGELIALHCRLAGLADDDVLRGELTERAKVLIDAHGGMWASRLGDGVTHVQYRLGLASAIQVVARSDALDVLDRAPIRDLGFTPDRNASSRHDDVDVAQAIDVAHHLASDPRLARIEILATGVNWGADALTRLLGSPHLTRLRALRIPDADAHGYAGRAIRSARLPALAMLAICGDWQSASGDECVDAVATATLPALRELALLNLSCRDEAARSLARSTTITQLHGLDFGWGSYNANRIGAGGAEAIANSPNVRALRRLVLDFNGIDDAGLAALAGSTQLEALRSLHVKSNELTDDGLRAFATGTGMPKLELLELTFNPQLTPAGITALAESPRLATLSSLWLRQIPLGPEAARAIASSPHARGLRDLNLLECELGDDGALALLASPHLDRLAKLQLAGNKLSAGVTAALHARWGTRVQCGEPT
ncbi:MAG: TIGR02996 domain-containing protein [Kofleriaceae bacterium]